VPEAVFRARDRNIGGKNVLTAELHMYFRKVRRGEPRTQSRLCDFRVSSLLCTLPFRQIARAAVDSRPEIFATAAQPVPNTRVRCHFPERCGAALQLSKGSYHHFPRKMKSCSTDESCPWDISGAGHRRSPGDHRIRQKRLRTLIRLAHRRRHEWRAREKLPLMRRTPSAAPARRVDANARKKITFIC